MANENNNNQGATGFYPSNQGILDRQQQFFLDQLEEHTKLLEDIARNTSVSVDEMSSIATKTTTNTSESIKTSTEVAKSLRDYIKIASEQTKYVSEKDIIESQKYKIEYEKRLTELLAQQSTEFKDQAIALQQFLSEQGMTNKSLVDLYEKGVFDIRGTGRLSGAGGMVYSEEETQQIVTAVSSIVGKIKSGDEKDKLDMGDFLKQEKLRYETDKNEEKQYRSEYLMMTKGLGIIFEKKIDELNDELAKSNYNLFGYLSSKFGGTLAAVIGTALAGWEVGKLLGKKLIIEGADAQEKRIQQQQEQNWKILNEEANLRKTIIDQEYQDRLKKMEELRGRPMEYQLDKEADAIKKADFEAEDIKKNIIKDAQELRLLENTAEATEKYNKMSTQELFDMIGKANSTTSALKYLWGTSFWQTAGGLTAPLHTLETIDKDVSALNTRMGQLATLQDIMDKNKKMFDDKLSKEFEKNKQTLEEERKRALEEERKRNELKQRGLEYKGEYEKNSQLYAKYKGIQSISPDSNMEEIFTTEQLTNIKKHESSVQLQLVETLQKFIPAYNTLPEMLRDAISEGKDIMSRESMNVQQVTNNFFGGSDRTSQKDSVVNKRN